MPARKTRPRHPPPADTADLTPPPGRHAAGIDAGDRTHWACVGATPDGADTVREFPAHTPGLRQLALLFLGAILARGRRTVTSWIRAAGLSREYRPCYTTVAAAGRKADLIAARLAHETVGHIWSEKDGVVKPLKEHVLSNGYLARVALTAIEANQLAARVAALEAVLARRCPS